MNVEGTKLPLRKRTNNLCRT